MGRGSMSHSGASIMTRISSAFPSFNRSPANTVNRDPSLNALERDLAGKLDQLKQSAEDGYLNLSWLQESMSVVLSTNSVVEALIPEISLPISERDEKWLDDYLDDSAKLLDVCNVLKEGIAEIEQYQMLVQLAVHSLDNKKRVNEATCIRARNALNECMEAIAKKGEELKQRSKLESCGSTLRRMGEKLATPVGNDAKGKAFLSAVYGAKVTTIFICGLLAANLSFKPRRPLSSLHVSSQVLWSSEFVDLQQKVKEEMEKKTKFSIAHLKELLAVDNSTRCLHEQLEKFLAQKNFPLTVQQLGEMEACVDALRNNSEELDKGLRKLEQQVNELFRMLVGCRVALLDVMSRSRS